MITLTKLYKLTSNIAVIEISTGDYGFDLIEQMITCVNTKLPLLPILRSKSEFEFDKKNPKILWIDQFGTLAKRMMMQICRNRVSSTHFAFLDSQICRNQILQSVCYKFCR